MNKKTTIIRWVLRVLVAAVFVFSAVSKIVGIDQFELYLFSFGFFPLNFCFILARLCIGAELVLALFTLCGWFPRTMRLVTSGVLLVFTLFLCYAALIGRNDNCQCFGQMVNLNPMQSMLKNAILLALVLVLYRLTPPKPRMRPHWTVASVLAAVALLAVPFGLSIPDNWFFGPGQRYNESALQSAIEPQGELYAYGVGKDRRLVAFVTPKCPYCKMARQKLDSILKRHNIPSSKLVYIEPRGIGDIREAKLIPVQLFSNITYDSITRTSSRPLVILLDGTKVVATYHLRNIDEDQIAKFFK